MDADKLEAMMEEEKSHGSWIKNIRLRKEYNDVVSRANNAERTRDVEFWRGQAHGIETAIAILGNK